MSKVFNNYGKEIDFEVAKSFMDPFLRETIHSRDAPCSDQIFFEKYCKLHAKAHGPADYQPAQENPIM